MKKFLIKAGFYSGMMGVVSRLRRRGFRVLMYHHVLREDDPFLPAVSAEVFSRQMKYLRRSYHIMDLGEMVKLIREERPLPVRGLAVTFDDGYSDFYSQAFPILEELEIPATVFVTTGFIDTDRVPWTEELRIMFKKTTRNQLKLEGEGKEHYRWSDQRGKLLALEQVKGLLKTLAEEDRLSLYEEIKVHLQAEEAREIRILNSKEIEELAAGGIKLGGHTVHHPILTRITQAKAYEEIAQSKAKLEEITGKPVEGFCYPNGEETDFSDKIEELVRRAGYEFACTTLEGVNTEGTDLYALRRSWTSEDCLPLFAAHIL